MLREHDLEGHGPYIGLIFPKLLSSLCKPTTNEKKNRSESIQILLLLFLGVLELDEVAGIIYYLLAYNGSQWMVQLIAQLNEMPGSC